MRVYNTLTRSKEEFIPSRPGKIGIYVCGPTVYNYIHIGNARTFLNFDLIRRYLRWRGFEVTFVQNITDVDDKIINRAAEEGISPEKVAQKYRQVFEEDMRKLEIEPPTYAPKATEHIPEMVKLVEDLLARGLAYIIDGDVYFSVRKFPEYGKLSKRSLEEMRAGERIEIDPRKEDPLDFALWKRAKEGEPYWGSPWGEGRPGWHLECSAMSLKYLGMSFDIHGGAQDLIFPHHENEIAQSEGATGQAPFVRYWIHAGLLNIDQEKMSKSLGNITLLREVLEKWPVSVIRMFVLNTHYRSPLDFSKEGLLQAKANIERIERFLFNLENAISTRGPVDSAKTRELKKILEETREKFVEAMDDDFNSALALGAIFVLVREVNEAIEGQLALPEKNLLQEIKDTSTELLGVLGLSFGREAFGLEVKIDDSLKVLANELLPEASRYSQDELLQALLDLREKARKEKNWALADQIRRKFAAAGIEIEDTPHGPRWKVKV